MANENHEQYDGNDISTYTDVINNLNMMTPDFIDGCTLSAGLLPCDNPRIQVTSQQPFQQGPNSLSPFYFDGGGNLWFDETELSDATDSRFQYLHIVYSAISDNQIASSLKVKNYRNFVTITQHTETINSTPYNYYELGITTKCGDNDDPNSVWTNSVLKPMYVIPDNNMRTGFFAEEIMCVQECDFGSGGTHGKVCTNLNYQQGRRNLIDGSGSFVEKAMWFAGLGLPQGYHISGGTQYGSNFDHHLQWQNNPSGFYAGSVINNEDDLLMLTAICGLKFEYNSVLYKPIVEGGVVTGYTSDMSETSEWDEWEDIGDHTIPDDPHPVPPPPSEDDDNYADMGIGTGGNVGGLSSYAIMTLSDLADLIGDFNSNLEAGQSVVNNFICCYKLGPLSSFICTTGSHNIIMSAYSTTGNNFVSLRADYAVISSQKSKVPLGSYTVPRKTNTFYDFSPYSTYELFIPCCGWIPLPDTVAGRTIDVYLLVDVASCSCKGVVRISGTTIAEVSGVIGSSVPFYINDSGLARSAIVQGIAQTMSSLIVGGVSVGSGNAIGAAYGVTNALQSAQQVAIAGNTNYTAVRGTNGDMTAYGNGEYCCIKITHPTIDSVVNEYTFAHTIGYLCNTVGTLNSFHGFTKCENPHIDISASSRERDEIKQLLELGVILPYGE